jgi:DNA-binding MarR family transcriptional regulator
MNDEAIKALRKAAGVSHGMAVRIIERLEAEGMAIYKKKVVKNERRPNSSQPMTDDLAEEIYRYFLENPEETQQSIANRFHVNIGRVNEIVNQQDDAE